MEIITDLVTTCPCKKTVEPPLPSVYLPYFWHISPTPTIRLKFSKAQMGIKLNNTLDENWTT